MGEGAAGPASEAGGGGVGSGGGRGRCYKGAALRQLQQSRGESCYSARVKGNWRQAPIHSDIETLRGESVVVRNSDFSRQL